ncbi:hypothetical protein Dsin_003907 [Dipteronia sinensis]|uniref:Uncharacterized protein n=1 Tax=Dipteronia sinensis TaxID=43782 RepID=A0AAE0EKS7_9ROSI|nr:hypothetical protein Dsin_003907 [Dipteronia sinensis]
MICSISTSKCGSNWLDRLRSTKGFPTADGLDLDHFLSNNNPNPDPNSPESTQSDEKPVCENRKEISSDRNGNDGGESEWFGIMSNVLSDLFNTDGGGEPDRSRRKKSSRKQTNPRICLVSTAAAAAEEEEERSSGWCERKDENAPAENANVSNAVDRGGDGDCGNEEEEGGGGEFDKGGGERELFGFSRNEVTVIDTSCMDWKFEKLVYRKRNVWKVREKKGKSKIVGRKRRKGSGCDGNVSVDGKKKMKVSNSDANGGGGGCASPSKHGQNPQDDKSEEVGKGTSDDLSQVPRKRASLFRLHKKTKKGGSSVTLVKGGSTTNKTKRHKSHGSDFEFEHREILCNKPLLATLQKGKEFGN